MGMIRGAFIFPHPPVMIPEVGKGAEHGADATLAALRKAAGEIGRLKPSTIILTSPHGPLFSDFIHINTKRILNGDMSKFGAPEIKLEFENNLYLTNKIINIANSEGIPCGGLDKLLAAKYRVSEELDHGAMVPLYFIDKEYSDFKLVHISIAGLPFKELYRFGSCIGEAVKQSNERAVFLASGDLSHKLTQDGPYGYDKNGPEYDRQLIELLKKPDPQGLLQFDESFLEKAGECGLRSFIMMFGALDGHEVKSNVYSYEGPFGVGYAIAEFKVGSMLEGESLMDKLDRADHEKINELRSFEDPRVALARKALEIYVTDGTVINIPDLLPEEMAKKRAGVFVSIKKSGQLRGCIGTISPVRKNIAEEIIYNAISAGTQDPRFNSVDELELDGLVYSVDVLGEAEAISTIAELDVVKYGVIVKSGRRTGLLLPNLEGIDTAEEQVSIALQKAGIDPSEKYEMERFEVIRYS